MHGESPSGPSRTIILSLNCPILIKRNIFTGKYSSKSCISMILVFVSLTLLVPVYTNTKFHEKSHSPCLFQHFYWFWHINWFHWLHVSKQCRFGLVSSYAAVVKMTMEYFPNVSHILSIFFFISTFASLSCMLSFFTVTCLFVLPALKSLSYTSVVEIV